VNVRRSVITGVGSYLPERIVSNEDLAKFVDTSDEWIVERSGIRQRHMAADGQFTSDLAIAAARAALENAELEPQEIDLIVMATTTPDNTFPATATVVQAALGMDKGAAFDLQAVCSGFVFGLSVADNFLKAGQFKNALVIGAETFSRLLDWECLVMVPGPLFFRRKKGAREVSRIGASSRHIFTAMVATGISFMWMAVHPPLKRLVMFAWLAGMYFATLLSTLPMSSLKLWRRQG